MRPLSRLELQPVSMTREWNAPEMLAVIRTDASRGCLVSYCRRSVVRLVSRLQGSDTLSQVMGTTETVLKIEPVNLTASRPL